MKNQNSQKQPSFFRMCIPLTYSSENGRVGRPPKPSTAKSRRFSRLSRNLRFVGKLAVLPQDYQFSEFISF